MKMNSYPTVDVEQVNSTCRRHRTGRIVLVMLATSCCLVPCAQGQSADEQSSAGLEFAEAADAMDVPEVESEDSFNGEVQVVTVPEESAEWGRRETLLASLTIFVLAVFLGFELITKVPPTLHTPLMSGSNAISGITLVGAILVVGVTSKGWLVPLLGTVAVITATVNAVGGFAVTHRMLAMFKRK